MKMTVGLAYKTLQQKLEFGNPQQIEALALIKASDELLDMDEDFERGCDCGWCNEQRYKVQSMTLEEINLKKETL